MKRETALNDSYRPMKRKIVDTQSGKSPCARETTPSASVRLPGVDADISKKEDMEGWRRLLVALRLASDKSGDEVFSIWGAAHEKICSGTNHTNLEAAYNDESLGGGGYKTLRKLLYKKLVYCPNPEETHGKNKCQRLLSDGHIGPFCPHCGYKTTREINGKIGVLSCDYAIKMGPYYKLILEVTDLAQRICDYHPTSMARLQTHPDNRSARVRCVQSALIARQDYHRNPDYFCLDVEAREGDEAWVEDADSKERVCVKVAKEMEDGYVVKFPCGKITVISPKERVEKIGGHIPINVLGYDDAGEVFQSSTLQFNTCAATEQIQNIAVAHMGRPEYNAMHGFEGGGTHHHNIRHRSIFYERQRRRLQHDGFTCEGLTLRVQYNGRLCVVHNPTVRRNEFYRARDHIENQRQVEEAGVMNVNSLNPVMENCTAVRSGKTAVYSFTANPSTVARDEQSSVQLHEASEKLRGTKEWEKVFQSSGCKGQSFAEIGNKDYDLLPDPTQNRYSRNDFGRMHQNGIRDNLFREFLLSFASQKQRRVLQVQYKAIRQARGTKPLKPYLKADKKMYSVFNKSSEKLHDKKHWCEHRMKYDLVPLFQDGSERSRLILLVSVGHYSASCFESPLSLLVLVH
jgi:hypothetical protein